MTKQGIKILLDLGLMHEYKGTYVLTRKGQIIYGGSDPYKWCNKNQSALESKYERLSVAQKVEKVFGKNFINSIYIEEKN